LFSAKVKYREEVIERVVFYKPYIYWDQNAPSALAFVPQLKYEEIHNDFGIFMAGNRLPNEDEWRLQLAIEIDIHPGHYFFPQKDINRDSVVPYEVLRLTKRNSSPLTWFEKIISMENEKSPY
jgi:hypothetical protein